MGHPYQHERIGLATIHGKHLAVAPPFRRLLGAEIVTAPDVDTDSLGTFSGEIARPAPVVETCALKAELAFRTMDVDCAIASEGSYGPIDRLPFHAAGVEIMAFVDRRRGLRRAPLVRTVTVTAASRSRGSPASTRSRRRSTARPAARTTAPRS